MRFILKILLSMMVTVLLSSILFAFVLALFSLRGAPPRVLLALFVPADGFSRQQIAGFAVLGAAFALLFACVFFARRTFSGVSPEGLPPAEEDACPAAVPGYGSAVPVQKSGKSGRNPSAAGRYVWFAGNVPGYCGAFEGIAARGFVPSGETPHTGGAVLEYLGEFSGGGLSRASRKWPEAVSALAAAVGPEFCPPEVTAAAHSGLDSVTSRDGIFVIDPDAAESSAEDGGVDMEFQKLVDSVLT